MRSYSFLNTVVLVNGQELTGWAEGDDVISIKRLSESATHKIGAAGEMAVSLSADRSGEFEFKLLQTSDSNQYLNKLLQDQESLQGAADFPTIDCQFQDVSRQDISTGSAGYIKKMTDLKRGEKQNDQSWTIVVENLDTLLGGD